MSFFDSRISRLQSRAMRSLSSFFMLAEWLGRLMNKKCAIVRSFKRSLSGPALQRRMLSQEYQAVDEAKPEGPVGVWLSGSLCRWVMDMPPSASKVHASRYRTALSIQRKPAKDL
jgi:hypothetical protein